VVPEELLDTVETYARRSPRPIHARIALDFAVRYLCEYARDPKAELVSRGFLAQPHELVFGDVPGEQRRRLRGILQFVYGKSLSRGQVEDILRQPGLHPTDALEAAAAELSIPAPADDQEPGQGAEPDSAATSYSGSYSKTALIITMVITGLAVLAIFILLSVLLHGS
jgi:hypothetical protein